MVFHHTLSLAWLRVTTTTTVTYAAIVGFGIVSPCEIQKSSEIIMFFFFNQSIDFLCLYNTTNSLHKFGIDFKPKIWA